MGTFELPYWSIIAWRCAANLSFMKFKLVIDLRGLHLSRVSDMRICLGRIISLTGGLLNLGALYSGLGSIGSTILGSSTSCFTSD